LQDSCFPKTLMQLWGWSSPDIWPSTQMGFTIHFAAPVLLRSMRESLGGSGGGISFWMTHMSIPHSNSN
jgi:hypothetical protein